MIRKLVTASLLMAVIAAVGCATAASSGRVSLAQPDIQLLQVSGQPDIAYLRGPVSIRFLMRIRNNSSEAIALRSLELRTMGLGAYRLNTGSSPISKEIAAGETVEIPLSAWGYTEGGYLTSSVPVSVRGIARFDTPEGAMQTVFTTELSQQTLPR